MAGARAIPMRVASAWLAPLSRMGVPLGVSIGLHLVLLAGFAGAGWTLRLPTAVDDLGSPVLIVAPPPPPLALAQTKRKSGPEPEVVVYTARDEVTAEDLPDPPPSAASAGNRASPGPGRTVLRDQPATSQPAAREAPRPQTTFAGVGVREVRSVVYVVDGSGAMVTNLKWVMEEVERSIVALDAKQSFQVVLFRDRAGAGPTTEVFRAGAGLIPATAANKAAVAAWLQQVRPSGRSNPMDGVKKGLALEPDVVFLLSRGMPRTETAARAGDWSRGPQAVLKELDGLNPRAGNRRRVIIKTIQFLEDDPTGTMQAIAGEHGNGPGSYSVVTLDQLRRGR